VGATETRQLIAQALERLQAEVPALRQLKLVVRLELRARGGDVPIWRVEVPGPRIDRDPAGDARVDVSVARSHFNELAREGRLKHWADAYEHGHVKVSGDAAVIKLLANVMQRRLARARA
jgi:SCP-2 sterol transfer family